jgi:hypothetical protein
VIRINAKFNNNRRSNNEMKRLAVLTTLCLIALSTQAQQQPSQEEINALLQSVAAQREAASNQVAQLSAKLTVLTAELEKAKKSAETCKPPAKAEEKK